MTTIPKDPRVTTVARPDIFTPAFLQAMRDAGIIEAYLFGSVSRGEERPDSDIDLLVKVDDSVKGLAFFGISDQLAEVAGRQVDVMTDIDPFFEPYVLPTLVPIQLGAEMPSHTS